MRKGLLPLRKGSGFSAGQRRMRRKPPFVFTFPVRSQCSFHHIPILDGQLVDLLSEAQIFESEGLIHLLRGQIAHSDFEKHRLHTTAPSFFDALSKEHTSDALTPAAWRTPIFTSCASPAMNQKQP